MYSNLSKLNRTEVEKALEKEAISFRKFYPPSHPKVLKAFDLAIDAHGNQMYGKNIPYSVHLQDVYGTLTGFGYSANNPDHLDLMVACPLHDALEDTALSYSDIVKELGEDVAEIVYCVTDDKNGRTRKEKKNLTYPKIASNPDSIILKLADRIANMENAKKSGKPKGDKNFGEMYVKEYKKFRWMLHKPGHADEMWGYLDRLVDSFKCPLTSSAKIGKI